MQGLVNYLKEIYDNCKLSFNVYVDGKIVFETNPLDTSEELVEATFLIHRNKVVLQVEKKNKDILKLIEFCIKTRYKESYNDKEKVIVDLLSNTFVSKEKIKELTYTEDFTYLISISIDQKLEDAMQTLRDIYKDTGILILKYNESINLIGIFEDIEEHVSSISETINTSVYEKCYISYNKINDYEKLSYIYLKCINRIELGKKYKIVNNIYSQESLLFEEMLDSLGDDIIFQITEKFDEVFSQMDEDMIKTIETFLKLDLNLSESAKQLYVHRNTLIYRLDKIEKYTECDIRKFNDACLFKIAFSIWKQKMYTNKNSAKHN